MRLQDFMTPTPYTVRPDDSLNHAMQVMAWTESQHLPVTMEEDGKLVGVLTERDVLRYRVDNPDCVPEETPVEMVMHPSPQTASADSSLSEAAGRLAISEIGCLPVTDKGRLIGLVTRTDVLSAEVRSAMEKHQSKQTVSDVMSHNPISVAPDEYLLDAAKLMREENVRHLPVIENGKVIGILSDRDVQAAVRDPRDFLRDVSPVRRDVRVKDAMSTPALRVQPQEDCATAAGFFVQFRASAAPVTAEDGTLVGMLSYVDLLRGMSHDSNPAL